MTGADGSARRERLGGRRERENGRLPGGERLPGRRRCGAVERSGAPRRAARGLGSIRRVGDRGGESHEQRVRLGGELRRRHAGEVARRPGEAEAAVARGARRVRLRGDVVLHQLDGDVRPAEGGVVLPGGVRERAVGAAEKRLRRRGGGRGDGRQRRSVLQVLVQRVATSLSRLRRRPRRSGRRRTAPATSRSRSGSGRSRSLRPRTSPAAAPGRRRGRRWSGRSRSRTPHRGRRAARRRRRAGPGGRRACSRARCPFPGARRTRARSAPRCHRRRRRSPQRPCAAAPRPRRVPGVARGRDPRRPAGDVDLRQSVEGRSERADPPGLIGAELGLVRGERRHGDVVLGARRRVSPPASWRGAASRSASRRRRAAAGSQPFAGSGRAVAARARARAAAWPPASRTEPGAPRPIGRRASRLRPHSIRRSRRRRCRSRVRVTSAATPVPRVLVNLRSGE